MLTCHVDAHHMAEGAVDNASGTAMLVERIQAISTSGRGAEGPFPPDRFGPKR
jgi:Zn-dependent M28 family amino/carboxypeptidase